MIILTHYRHYDQFMSQDDVQLLAMSKRIRSNEIKSLVTHLDFHLNQRVNVANRSKTMVTPHIFSGKYYIGSKIATPVVPIWRAHSCFFMLARLRMGQSIKLKLIDSSTQKAKHPIRENDNMDTCYCLLTKKYVIKYIPQ